MSLTTQFVSPITGDTIPNAYHRVAQVSIDNANVALCIITMEVYLDEQAYLSNTPAIKRFQLIPKLLSGIETESGTTFLDKVYANIKATESLYAEATIG